ncbi:MAG: N-acetylmuramoyl-L-alanine amidase [bacterium]
MKENRRVYARIFFSILVLTLLTVPIAAEQYYTCTVNTNTDSLIIYRQNDVDYIDLSIFTALIGADVNYKNIQEEVRIETGRNYVILSLKSPFYRSKGNVLKMKHTPLLHDGLILFPVSSLEHVFKPLLPENADFSSGNLTLAASIELRKIEASREYIDLTFSSQPDYESEITTRDIILFVKNCTIDTKKFKRKNNNSIIRVIEAINDKKEATLILTLEPVLAVKYIEKRNNILRIYLKKRESQATNKNSLKLNTVIIDAGHGGRDPGALGPTGLKEKTMNLDIAIRLKKLIEANHKNIKVVMTRTDDRYVSLQERTMLANKYPNAVFVSIHCNASLNRKARGAETYFLSPAKTDWARAVEARENASLAFDLPEEEKEGLDFILWDMAQNEFLSESSRLAELIQEEFESNCKYPRGLNQAGFYVLKGNYMPAVLVETAFISNNEEEKDLKKPDFRKKLAKNIYNGLRGFIDEYSQKSK